MKKDAPYEFQKHFLGEWSTINSSAEIAEKSVEYEDVRRILRSKFYNSFAKGRYEARGTNENCTRRLEHFQSGNNMHEKKHFQSNGTFYVEKRRQLIYSFCEGPGHYAVD
ncbi:retrovirus-related Pol polyprotein from transposon 17.6 [Trichonephila clavipes]|nr:retrovirus-related Pol polyprotein from transposon 17.6 [Trichonephila clavipes]